MCYTEGDTADSEAAWAHKILEKARPQGGEPILGCQVYGAVVGEGERPQKGTGGLLGGTAGVLSVDRAGGYTSLLVCQNNFMLKTVRLLYVNDPQRVGNKPEERAGTLCADAGRSPRNTVQ